MSPSSNRIHIQTREQEFNRLCTQGSGTVNSVERALCFQSAFEKPYGGASSADRAGKIYGLSCARPAAGRLLSGGTATA
ncbi:hypothetical protein U9M48_032902 [Paspalum notatum var. saurae]|uniref:Uncharacterized protein n=1 Tax=Paspalum notatum var. saurae TaxID=547442 RepID=A0AAQ3U710_PASNO